MNRNWKQCNVAACVCVCVCVCVYKDVAICVCVCMRMWPICVFEEIWVYVCLRGYVEILPTRLSAFLRGVFYYLYINYVKESDTYL